MIGKHIIRYPEWIRVNSYALYKVIGFIDLTAWANKTCVGRSLES